LYIDLLLLSLATKVTRYFLNCRRSRREVSRLESSIEAAAAAPRIGTERRTTIPTIGGGGGGDGDGVASMNRRL